MSLVRVRVRVGLGKGPNPRVRMGVRVGDFDLVCKVVGTQSRM